MKVYLDNAATTRMHPRVFEKMMPFFKENYGNPSSIHDFGRKVRVAIEDARETVAGFINADASEIYFTSGGTEANNFPVFGITEINRAETGKDTILLSNAEHSCVLEATAKLENKGFIKKFLPVAENGNTTIEEVGKVIDNRVSLISLIHINNETGAVNDISNICDSFISDDLYTHTDAVQSFGKSRIDVKKLKVNSLSAAGHKIYGPKGIGFTYVKAGTPMEALIIGGSQERNRRGGTENPAAIIGLAEAVKIADSEIELNYNIVSALRSEMITGLKNIDNEGIIINCENEGFPYILSATFRNDFYKNDAESMLMYLDLNGIAVSNGAACTSGTLKPSHVIMAMGYSAEDARGTIRFSFSPENNTEEIEYTLEVINRMASKFRR